MGKSYDVCLLRPREVVEFERHRQKPDCERGKHTHIEMSEADRRVLDGHGRYLDEAHRYMAAEPARVWASRGSYERGRGSSQVLQLVRGCVRGRAGQFRTKVPAHGAHGRATSVRQTNVKQEVVER